MACFYSWAGAGIVLFCFFIAVLPQLDYISGWWTVSVLVYLVVWGLWGIKLIRGLNDVA